ncbi:GNAT family N-acetyltransferase [Celerinatantimonas diazotrophica]|uniref:GNAT family acetyltransferase n=1 Tax=Celerinatantimonas diazotrophica TaxID=412034 RepID=A0A4R1J9D2_9GAMM|nr:GNAT family N-acetyltransferase [Celerinatantimonas diazotrophica]TCK47188.1 GNAT family acetyltransferase [Celerinatantimonas diazotrophica]CAG9295960.1 putative N-acetyltransferase YafP [Celerinatantimonas diazotrophica]
MIKIRNYKESDAQALWDIFYHTVHNVNIRDYSKAQVSAWAPDNFDFAIWQRKMNSILPIVAQIDGEIVGYADVQNSGLIDHFFCHYEHQGKGVGRSLMERIMVVGKAKGISRFFSEVSITARPFYEKFGFIVVKEQTVEMRGEKLQNFVMEKFS